MSGDIPALRVLVPRGGRPGERLATALQAAGFTPVIAPLISFDPPADEAPLRAGVAALAAGDFDWIVITSERTVDALAQIIEASQTLTDVTRGTRVAVVGPSTGGQARAAGLRVDCEPGWEKSARGLVATLGGLPHPRDRALRAFVPHSSLARPELVDGLRGAGWQVTAAQAYTTVTAAHLPASATDIDVVMLTSSSTAQTWARLAGPAATGAHAVAPAAPGAPQPLVISIGPRTTETALALGLTVAAEASSPDSPALVATLLSYLTGPQSARLTPSADED